MPRLSSARLLPLAVLVTSVWAIACQNEVAVDDGAGAQDGAEDALPVGEAADDDTGAADDDAADGDAADDDAADDDGAGADDDADDAGTDDVVDGGAVVGGGGSDAGTSGAGVDAGTNGGNAPGPPPAEIAQSCVEWTDCGPWYVNENSGFDCVSGECACDATGQWAVACADGGAVWSDDTCFCYWGTTALPSTSPDPEPDDEVYCWWDWWGRECEPDTWVDTSYYAKVCYSDGTCYWDYVDDGYYTDGDCEEQWVSRCSDGTVWRYF